MKRALSLILAMLMLLGCMSFSAVAEETTYDIPAILEANGTQHIYLNEAIATAPVQDGVVKDNEYSYFRSMDSSDKSGSIVVGLESIQKNDVLTEYFAYDANYVYYAAEGTGTLSLGPKIYFNIAGYDGPVSATEKEAMLENFGIGDWFGYNIYDGTLGEYAIHPKTQAFCDLLNNDFKTAEYPAPATVTGRLHHNYGEPHKSAYNAACKIATDNQQFNNGKAATTNQKVFEIRISRKYIPSADNVYAFLFRPWSAGVIVGDNLSTVDQTDLGTTKSYAPRFIILGQGCDLLDVLGDDGVIKLDTPIDTPPIQDGKVTAEEYGNFSVVTTPDNNADRLQAGALNGSNTLTEYFAYDADYIYYAAVGSGSLHFNKQQYFNIMGTPSIISTADVQAFANNYNVGERFEWGVLPGTDASLYANYYHLVTGTQEFCDRLNADYATKEVPTPATVGNSYLRSTYGAPYRSALYGAGYMRAGNVGVGKLQDVVELKISRNYFYSADNTYAFVFRFWNDSVRVMNKLDSEAVTSLGLTGDTVWYPRFMVLGDAPAYEYDVPALLEVTGTSHAKLSTPIAIAPVQNGVIGTDEYTLSRDVAGTDNVNKGVAVDGAFKEYFAYDADWIYYAIEAQGDYDFGARPTFFFDPNWKTSSLTFNTDVFYKNLGDYVGYAFYTSSEYGLEFRTDDSIALANKYTSSTVTGTNVSGRWLSSWTDHAKLLRENFCVMGLTNHDTTGVSKVVEIKFSRNSYKSNDNTYAYYMTAFETGGAPRSGGDAGGEIIATRLSEEQKRVLSSYTSYAPRFIIIEEDIITKQTASIRIDTGATEESGLRFKTDISNKFIADLRAQGYEVQVGTLIAPTDTIGVGTFTELKHEFGTAWKDYVDVIADVDNPYDSGTAYNTYAGSLVSIYESNIDRSFSARGYVKATKGETVKYFYSDIVASRDVSTIASAAKDDVTPLTNSNIYKYVVAEDTSKYSPYTKEQRDVIALFIKKS